MKELDLLHHEITRLIIQAFYQVHRELGFGFLECVYVNALCVLLRELGLRVEREVPYEMIFHGAVSKLDRTRSQFWTVGGAQTVDCH